MKQLSLSRLVASLALVTASALAQQPATLPTGAAEAARQNEAQTTVIAAPSSASPTNLASPGTAQALPAEALASPASPAPAVAAPAGATTNAALTPPLTTNGVTNGQVRNGTPAPSYVVLPNGQKGVRLNFRGASLEVVLNYLSKAAGFIINLETPVSGKVDVWSDQPVSIDEAVNLLDTVLAKNGYAAIRNGKMLTIVTKSSAKTRNIPVKQFATTNSIEQIPKSDQMATYTIAVRSANAVNMVRDLEPLRPEYATLTANESANALVLTATEADARRFAEIVRALDSSIAGILSVRVFTLKFADAKDLASEIKELFPAQSGTTGGRGGPGFNPMQMMFGGRGGRGGGPGGFGGGGNAAGGGTSEARQAASRVTAVADERTNSLVVSAPEEVLEVIQTLVEEVDKSGENVSTLQVFKLKNADPTETADLLMNLFPDDTRSSSAGNRTAMQFGGRGGFGGRMGGFGPGGFFGGGGRGAGTTVSARAQQQMRVVAVPEPRTSSLVVTASKDMMPEIANMIADLDASDAKRQRVHVFKLDNADSDNVQQVLQDMFGSSMQNRNTQRLQNNALNTRQQQSAQTIGQGIMQSQQQSSRNAFGN